MLTLGQKVWVRVKNYKTLRYRKVQGFVVKLTPNVNSPHMTDVTFELTNGQKELQTLNLNEPIF